MKPNKIVRKKKGGEGSIIVASFGTFQHRNKYKEPTECHIRISFQE